MTNEELVDKVDELEMINKRLVEELMWSINAYLDITNFISDDNVHRVQEIRKMLMNNFGTPVRD